MERLLARAAAAAKASRAEIERQGLLAVRWCDRCQQHHPPTFRWEGRNRPWHTPPPRVKRLEAAARPWAEL